MNTGRYYDLRNFTPLEQLTEEKGGAFSHPVFKFEQGGNIFYKKTENRALLLAIEATAGQIFKLLMPYQPETLLAVNPINGETSVLSQELPGYKSLADLDQNFLKDQIHSGNLKGFGSVLTASYFMNETDSKLGNLGVAMVNGDTRVIKIDGDWCLSALRDPVQFRQGSEITTNHLNRIPLLTDYNAYNLLDRVEGGLYNLAYYQNRPNNRFRLIEESLPDAPHFRQEVNEMILKTLLMPQSLVHEIASRNANDMNVSRVIANEINARQQQMFLAASQNANFKLFLQTPAAEACLAATIVEMESFQQKNAMSNHFITAVLQQNFQSLKALMLNKNIPLAVVPAAVIPVVAPAPVIPVAAPALVIPVIAPAPVIPVVAPAPVIPVIAPAPVIPVIAPAPVIPVAVPIPARDIELNISTINEKSANKKINDTVTQAITNAENNKKIDNVIQLRYAIYFKAAKDIASVIELAKKKISQQKPVTKNNIDTVTEYQAILKKSNLYQKEFMRLANIQIENLYRESSPQAFIAKIDILEMDSIRNAIKNIPGSNLKKYSQSAALNGNIGFLTALKSNHPKLLQATLNKKDNQGKTPLHHAAVNGDAAAFSGLLALGGLHTPLSGQKYDKNGYLPSHYLAVGGHMQVFENLRGTLSEKEMLDLLVLRDKNGMTVVHHAVINGNINLLNFINTHHGPLTAWMVPDSKGFYPVHHAAHNGNVDVLNALKTMGANLDQPLLRLSVTPYKGYQAYDKGDTAAIIAIKNNEMPGALMLLENTHELPDAARFNFKNINTEQNREQLVSHYIIEIKNTTASIQNPAERSAAIKEMVSVVLNRFPAQKDQNALGLLLQTPKKSGFFNRITQAVGEKDLDKLTMTFLKDLGLPKPALHTEIEKLAVACQRLTEIRGIKPIKKATLQAAKDTVKYAMKQVVNNIDSLQVNHRDSDGLTAAHLIAKIAGIPDQERIKIIEKLKSKSANFDMKDPEGHTAIHFAITNSGPVSHGVMQALKTAANINMVGTHDNVAPTILAVKSGNVAALHSLKKLGSNLTYSDQNGDNLAHHATKITDATKMTAMLAALKNENVNLFQPNQLKETPISLIFKNPEFGNDTIKFFSGLKLNAVEGALFSRNMTLLSLAEKNMLVEKIVNYIAGEAPANNQSKHGMVAATRDVRGQKIAEIYNSAVLGPILEKNGLSKTSILQAYQAKCQVDPKPVNNQVNELANKVEQGRVRTMRRP
jgi:ankyrin repeat protein